MNDEEVRIGKYTLSVSAQARPWLGKEGGEGMEISSPENLAKLEALLDKFWHENF